MKIYGTDEQPLYVFYANEIETVRHGLEIVADTDDDSQEYRAMRDQARTLVQFLTEE